NGGALVIGAGAMFDALVVNAGAILDVETEATVRRASYVAKDGSVVPFSISGNIASGVVIDGLGWLTVTPGGTALATVLDGGKQYVYGNAVGTRVDDRGIEVVYSGGVASGTVVGSGGRQNVLEGGTAKGTSVTSGVIDVAGTASNLTLHNAAMLTGTGRIASDLTLDSGSTLAATAPGAGLTVSGALDFKTGSTYAVTVASTAAGGGAGANVPAALGGVTTVTGNVAIAPGATLTLTAMPGLYTPGMKFAIVNYGGVASGRFDTVDDDFAYVAPTLSYDAGEIAVTLVASPSASFASVAGTGDQAGVGTALTRVYRAGGNTLTTDLLTASPAQARAALTQLAGDEAPAFRQIAERRMDQAQGMIGERLGAVHAADGGAAATAGATAGATTGATSGSAQSASALSGTSGSTADPENTTQRELWAQASYQNARTAGNDATGAGAYLDRSTALTIGHDRAITPTVRVGAALMLNTDTVSFSDRGANGRVNGAQALLYGSFTPADRPIFVNTIAGYGWWNNTLSRQVTLGALSGNANGSFDTTAASLYTEAGLNLASAIGAMQPYVGVKVGRYQQQGHAESAASGTNAFDLRYDDAHTVAASSLLGVRVKHDGAAFFGHGVDWQMDVAWQHRFGPGDGTLQAAFVDAPTIGYQVGGTKMDHDALRTTLGVRWALNRTTSFYVNAGMSLGATTQAYAGNAGVQWRW
ncbi:MAG: autotransporter domain-containing protein, partial [Janthinobacterium lividum]